MNVIILSDGARILGGAEKVAITSAVELARRGHHVVFFAGIGPVDPVLEGKENLDVVCLHQSTTKEASGPIEKLAAYRTHVWNRPAIARFQEVVESLVGGKTVVHAHCYKTILSSGLIAAAFDSQLPVVATQHDYGIACPIRTFFDSGASRICHRIPMSASCVATNCCGSYAQKAAYVWNQRIHDRRARVRERLANVIYVSQFSRRILQPFLRPGINEWIVQNPADVTRADPVPVASNAAVLFLGRLAPEKDPATLARAARLADMPCVFVGEGSERGAVLEANPAAEVTGWVDSSEVRRRLQTARCLAIPSIWYEGAPLSTLEALGHGVPVVTSDCNASIDNVADGETGFHFPAGDAEALADRLRKLQDDATATALGAEAYRRFWADPPTLERHVDRLLGVYEEML